ncbi:MAG TPA: hypothetical protein VF546_18775 [Pyrinomonadaceae bacterium]|jgi:hypothetical protein
MNVQERDAGLRAEVRGDARRAVVDGRGWRALWRRRRADACVVAAVTLFFVAFFPHVLFGDRFIIAGDAYYYSYPLRTVAWRMIRAGQLPLWTPHVLSGYPLLSMSQVAVGYPLTWGYLFIRGPWAEQLYVLAPFLLAPLLTYAYCRELGRSRLAALLAGLAFAYGGMMCGFISNSGMLTNGSLWAPLVLLYVERARTRPLAHALPRAAVAYTLAVLAGHGQSYVYTGLLALAYGLFLALKNVKQGTHEDVTQNTPDELTPGASDHASRRAPDETTRTGKLAWLTQARWRPVLTAAGALLLAAGVASFQLFEALRAARRSIRSGLSYEAFGEGSFAPREAALSILAPLYHYVDTSAYLAPLALLLAAVAIVCAWRGRTPRDARLWFWVAVAGAAFLLMLGAHTPLYRLVYLVPVVNSFRVPSRHAFEWTLALAVLAAYGWDATAAYFRARRRAADEAGGSTTHGRGGHNFRLAVALLLFAVGCVVAALWWRATSAPPVPNPSIYTGLPEAYYWLWKLAFNVVVCALAFLCFTLRAARVRNALLGATIMLACFAEPAAVVSCWWGRLLSLSAARLQLVAPATRYLQQFPPEEGRVYTRAGLFAEEFNARPRLDAPNLPALFGLHDAAGMEPLVLERYSRALGGVGPDSVTPRAGFPAHNEDLFAVRSRVLDLLNVRHVVTFANLKSFEDPLTYRDQIGLSVTELDVSVAPGATVALHAAAAAADTLALVTSLANSVGATQGEPVARVRVFTDDGQMLERELRAGVDTAEWAHERADVRANIKHGLAPVFDGRAGDETGSFQFYRYWARLALGAHAKISRVEIINVSPTAALAVWRASVYDTRTGVSTPLSAAARSEFWQTVYNQEQVELLRNTRAQPRAWLVTAAEAVDGEEALRRIRGESAHEFDPQRTALLEVAPAALPDLPAAGAVPAQTAARVVSYEPTRLRIETDAPTPSVLVVSEIFYPGWEARVDGQARPILLTDYLLRGVALPAGRHTVEMRYAATAARNGAVVSALALVSLCALFVYDRRASRLER